MKKSAVLLLALAISGCKCAQKDIAQSNAKPAQEVPCPAKGTCKTELLRNKSFTVIIDDHGRQYYKLVESAETHVVKHEYTQGNEETMPDSGYREEVIFEIGSAGQEFSLKDQELRQVKMLYGRFCFCPKDQVGYFEVNKGSLSVSGKESIAVALELEVDGVPHITKQVRAILK